MNAPSKHLARVCDRGHIHFGSKCGACSRNAPSVLVAEARRIERIKAAVKRRDEREDRERSACGIHRNTGDVCRWCASAMRALKKDLASQVPWHVRVQRVHTRRANGSIDNHGSLAWAFSYHRAHERGTQR